ncbi:MAG: peptidase M28, partial [Bryobacterales bacterium]|nr:peptidase M28 [Bryobacterales bacterium]
MRWLAFSVLLSVGCGAGPETSDTGIDPDRIAPHVRFLSHDLLEGRGVGGRSEALATEYLAAQLSLAGAHPAAADGTYFQSVPLVEITSQPGSVLELAGRTAKPLDEYVGNNERQTGREVFDAEIVYVGHGINAPEFDWDDYKDVDVTGKVVLLFTNEPPSDE